ncbi:MAG: TatD family nuclease-associated radical SAM protein [Shewanella psychromarinicola]|jgi:TatD family-associated radical SAM protein|uniref:TatD family nuclease-associated radical SAM protein n=1 Tax=Shewanella TaxID=22 RepID=UPI000C31D727|nr:TatD family nuclease-associated radical SAM protein [Shewanella sp. Actino-trap-3]PKG80022.1 radical SAM protein [Shewanella sp. Actino-trap-3]|tara:strand:- start:131334 stop:131951 length:618 start_codon:yes stop_codon:yes gene_type:complete
MNASTSPTPTLVYDIGNHRYLNITARCTLRCQFCPKHNGSKQVHDFDLSLTQRITAEDVLPLLGNVHDVEEYVFCGFGEPTLNLECLLQLAHAIKAQGGRVRLNTDGLGNHFHRRNILPELSQCIDSLSISLNADTPESYQQHCHPKLANSYKALLEFIQLAPQYIPQVQVSAINGLANVNIERCRVIAEQNGAIFKQRELDKIG